MDQPATRVGSSCALQGCLIGSVVLFVILLRRTLVVEADPNAPREALIAVDEAEEDLQYRKEQKELQNLRPSLDD